MSRGPTFRHCIKAGGKTLQYEDELTKFRLTHEEVKAAYKADAMNRRETT